MAIALEPRDQAAVVSACGDLPSPGLLVFPHLVESNIARMIQMAGSTDRLRPHLKTSKMTEVVRRFLRAGIDRFKCATLTEMAMALDAGARDILLAYQPVGPNQAALMDLAIAYPDARLSTIVDCLSIAQSLAETVDRAQTAEGAQPALGVYIDLDCGMHRTGIPPGAAAKALHEGLQQIGPLNFRGWHVYDGHIRDTDLEQRRRAVDTCFQPVWDLVSDCEAGAKDETKAEIIAGGTPSFPIHATDPRVICSPGTCVFWDAGYAHIVPDMPFDCAALLWTRIVSKQGEHLTIDLGHKAVSAENPMDRRVLLPAIPDAEFQSQSEEHLVLHTAEAVRWNVGDGLLGIPWHVCPSVALYDRATTIVDNRIDREWAIPARRRLGGSTAT